MSILKSITTKLGIQADATKNQEDKDAKQSDQNKGIQHKTSKKQPPEQTSALFSAILKKARVTEKTAHLTKNNQYVFDVDSSANKTQIARAVFAIYKIKPTAVNIIRTKGKTVRIGKINGTRSDNKKAIVTMPAGKTLGIYENV